MIENLQSIDVFSPTFVEIFLNLMTSLICSLVVTFIYKYTYQGVGYSRSFVNSFIFLSMITALVIMSIGNSLARAFGLVGALSIIRFRTAIKDTSDLVYIFLALAIGMSSGVGYYNLAITGTIIISLILVIVSKTERGFLTSSRYLLQFRITGSAGQGSDTYLKAMDSYCSHFEIMNIRTDDANDAKIYSYSISLKRLQNADAFINELRTVPGLQDVNLFFDQQVV